MDNSFSNLLMDECPPDLRSPEDEAKPTIKKASARGATTSFGFRKPRPPAAATAQNANTPHIIAADMIGLDSNGNDKVMGRLGVARLPPPKKEAKATTKVSRFGFRQANANRLNRVADANINPPTRMQYPSNNNVANDSREREKIESEIKAKVEMQEQQLAAAAAAAIVVTDTNRNRQVAKFTLQSNHLPKPVSIKFLESKQAKTLANNNRKRFVSAASSASTTGTSGDESSILTEDSGVELTGTSTKAKPRSFDVVLTVNNRFDVRDRPTTTGTTGLPTLRPTSSQTTRSNFGFVRNRAMDYQQNVIAKREQQHHLKKSSPVLVEVDKSYKRNEKIAQFIKQKSSSQTDASSSDDQIWPSHAGEAMAEMSSIGTASSSEESKDNVPTSRMMETVESQITAKAKNRLSLVDPTFAAIAAASDMSSILIEDEPSPVDSIACSYSEGNSAINDKVKQASSANEKEMNAAASPGSPTNASNSLSLTDDRDDFLIDDEIADQPALLCDDTLTSNQVSEATVTPAAASMLSTPNMARRHLGAMLDGSPLSIRNKALLLARAASLDTLSPCESLASDDCMMDYDLSSGVEDLNDKTETNECNFNDLQVGAQSGDKTATDIMMRDWSSILASAEIARSTPKSSRLSLRTSRLIKSREATPSSSVPDSPRSDRVKKSSRTSLQGSSRSSGTGYESDDSVVRIDRSQHYAMQQDVMGIKTLLLKLKRVLHESSTEDYLLTSETHNSLADNGFFGGFNSDSERDGTDRSNEELINLRRQVEYLQGQLEDTERLTQRLREELTFLRSSESAPASVVIAADEATKLSTTTCNAATQTERVRPFSASPMLLQGTPHTNENPGSLVSSNDSVNAHSVRSSSLHSSTNSSGHYNGVKNAGSSPIKLWRMPGEPAATSAIPRRSCSRSRISNNTPRATSSTSPVI